MTPLVWTEKIPTEPGHYLIDDKGFAPWVYYYDGCGVLGHPPGRRYAGPIPMPVEPEPDWKQRYSNLIAGIKKLLNEQLHD